MKRALLSIALGVLAAHGWAKDATPPKPPISTKAELDAYLRNTPPGTSPLDALSPGGRKRFLGDLTFRHERIIPPIGDPAAELTRPQIERIFALFGETRAVSRLQLGLTAKQKAKVDAERAAYARARGCTVQSCPESPVEQGFDQLARWDEKVAPAQNIANYDASYDRFLSPYQTPAALHDVSAPDLRLLKRASENTVRYQPDIGRLSQLQADLDEMQRRGMAVDGDYLDLYRGYVAVRHFDQANALARAHPGMGVDALPSIDEKTDPGHHWPTALGISSHAHNVLVRKSYDPDASLRVVVATGEGCHFCDMAADAIKADPSLHKFFAANGFWLADQGNDFNYASAWDTHYPGQPMHIAWQNSEWPMLDWTALPTFYVFRHGKLVKKFFGWRGVADFRKTLRDVGALH